MSDRAKDSFTKAGRARNAQRPDKRTNNAFVNHLIFRIKYGSIFALIMFTYIACTGQLNNGGTVNHETPSTTYTTR